MEGVAVKVAAVPAQIVLAEGDIEILAGEAAFTNIVTAFDVAGLPLTQLKFEVSTQVTTSLLAGV